MEAAIAVGGGAGGLEGGEGFGELGLGGEGGYGFAVVGDVDLAFSGFEAEGVVEDLAVVVVCPGAAGRLPVGDDFFDFVGDC